MTDFKPFLKQLISLPGLSGYEEPVRTVIADTWRPLVDELTISPLGSLHGLQRGDGPEPRPKILLAAHMDAIGMMVTGITPEGLLRFTRIGGVDPRILPAMPVMVHATRGEPHGLPGVIAQPPDRLLPKSQAGRPPKMEYLLVDTGLEPEEVNAAVRVGDLVSFDTAPVELSGDTLAGHSLDNRASVAAVTVALEELHRTRHAWDVVAVATVQEEETLGGAYTSPVSIRPQLAVAVDVTFARGPGASDWRSYPMGKGVTLDWGPNVNPNLFNAFKTQAEQLDLTVNIAVHPHMSGTDAMGLQVVEEGIPTMVLSIPLRYMHTPVEVISYKDVSRTGRLMAAFIAGLAPDFMETNMRWEEDHD
jgi:tetrahedral aminopeptidase